MRRQAMSRIKRKMKNISKRLSQFRHISYYRVNMIWDSEANVWVATSDDVPGLVLESESFDALIAEIKDAVPELLELNGKPNRPYNIAFQAKRMETVAAYG